MSDELPQEWARVKLGEVCSHPQYGWTSKASRVGRIKYLRTTDISGGTIDWSEVPFCADEPEDVGKYEIRPDDILVSRAGSVGVSIRVEQVASTTVFASYLIRFRAREGVHPKFIEAFLKSEAYWSAIAESSAGIAIPNVNASKLADIELPIPPTSEQRRIVAKLEEVLGKVDASRARLAKIPALLKRFRQSVLAAACSGRLTTDWREKSPGDSAASYIEELRSKRPAKFQDASVRADLDLPEIPESWTWTNLRFLLSPKEAFCYGVVQPGANDPKGALLVRAGDLKNGWVDTQALRRIPKNIHEAYRRSQLNGGEILVTVVGAGIGETALVQPECAGFNIARAVAKLPVREFNARYVRNWLTTNRAVTWMKGDSREVARPTLNIEQLQTLPVPIPPLPEQQEIVRRVEALFALADRIEARFRQAQARVEQLTPALLAQAFRGELVPQDPADEPAAVLLERMRVGHGPATSAGPTQLPYPEPAPRELKVAEPRRRKRQ